MFSMNFYSKSGLEHDRFHKQNTDIREYFVTQLGHIELS